MKKILIIFIILLSITNSLSAQNDEYVVEDYSLLSDSSQIGLNLGVRIAFGQASKHRLIGEFGIDMGVTINGCIEAGGFFAGLYSDEKYDYILGEDYMLSAFYGGVYVQPIFFQKRKLHLAIPVRMGAGKINYETPDYYSDSYKVAKSTGARESTSALIVFEPGVQLEFQATKHIQLAASVSYRDCLTALEYQKTEKKILRNNELNHFYYALTLRFGKF